MKIDMIPFSQFAELQEAAYAGNIGIMELVKFYEKATPDLVHQVKELIASKRNMEAWAVVQKVLNIKLDPRGLK